MFYYLDGTVAHLQPSLAVIDCSGVGYACSTTSNTLSKLVKGQKARLYTYLHVREDLFDLYGFSTLEELNCFKLLIGVSGVGPKAAASILSHTTPERFALSILSEDEKALSIAPGIGKKIAQRIILELKDKLSKDALLDAKSIVPGDYKNPSGKETEAAAALAVLGYTQKEIGTVLKGIDIGSLSLEEIIREALKKAMK